VRGPASSDARSPTTVPGTRQLFLGSDEPVGGHGHELPESRLDADPAGRFGCHHTGRSRTRWPARTRGRWLTGRRLAILAVPVSLSAALAAQADGEVLPGEFVLHGPGCAPMMPRLDNMLSSLMGARTGVEICPNPASAPPQIARIGTVAGPSGLGS
jgi:hypothetical protein